MPEYATSDQFARNLKGAALYALSQWKFWGDIFDPGGEAGEATRAGRMDAYADVLRHVTGRGSPGEWLPAILAMDPVGPVSG
jgi:hypothetical protein